MDPIGWMKSQWNSGTVGKAVVAVIVLVAIAVVSYVGKAMSRRFR